MPEFTGSLVAIVTPFREGQIDLPAFHALVEWQITAGTSGIVVAGTTGEAATLRPGEREKLCRHAQRIAKGRCPVIVGTGTNSTLSSSELTRAARDWGADGALVVTPYYNKPTQEGLFRHFREVSAAGGGLPVIAYDVPGRTGVQFSEQTVRRIADLPAIVALKDATGDIDRVGRLAPELPITFLSGDDAATLAMMAAGAQGVISVAANVVPEAMAKLVAMRDAALHEKLLPLFKALFIESNPIPVKFALARMRRIANEVRLPLVPLSKDLEPTVEQVLRDVGVL